MVAGAAGLGDHPYGEGSTRALPVAQFDRPARPIASCPEVGADFDLGEQGLERLTAVLTSACDGHRKVIHRNGRSCSTTSTPIHWRNPPSTPPRPERSSIRCARRSRRPSGPLPRRGPGHPPGVAPDASPEELAELERQMECWATCRASTRERARGGPGPRGQLERAGAGAQVAPVGLAQGVQPLLVQ